MASISEYKPGRWRIQFVNDERERKSIYLGNCARADAEQVRRRVKDLNAALIVGHPPSDATCRWLNELPDMMYAKLVAVGLAKSRDAAKLGAFTRQYIDGRSDIKPGTRQNLEQSRAYLREWFDEAKSLRSFNEGDAEDFQQHMIRSGRSEATMRRAIGRARQFFKAAIKRGLCERNPFEGISAAVRGNEKRLYFVSRDEADRVVEACPDAQWQLIFALARFGGLRCPSETLALTWEDVNWESKRVRVPSPKTEHLDGGGSRVIPLFSELQPYLLEVFEQAEPGIQHVITRYRGSGKNLRTQLIRIIRRAGLKPWPKPFQNLRSTRETELMEDFPIQAVCKWIGNSEAVARRHYLQVTDEHYDRAIRGGAHDAKIGAHNVAQKDQANAGNAEKGQSADASETAAITGVCVDLPADAKNGKTPITPRRGFEPLLPG